MSSILKALRKLEDEKSSLGEGNVDLARDILKRNYAARKTVSLWLPMVMAAMFLVAGGSAAWWYFGFLTTPQQQLPAVKMASPVVTIEKLPDPEPIVPVIIPEAVETHPKPIDRPATSVDNKVVKTLPPPIDIPLLRVDEIVFQQQPSARLAVINDLPVMEGTDIDGARVVEIMPGSVRFSIRGISFSRELEK